MIDEERLLRQVKVLSDRFEGEGGMHERMRQRMLHFHNDPSVDPFMDGGTLEQDKSNFAFAQTQTTKLRNVAVDLVGRLTENQWVPEIIPVKNTAPGKKEADIAEQILRNGFSQIQKQTGLVIQDALAQGLTVLPYGVLHWEYDPSVYDGAPDYEEYDDEPEDSERFEKDGEKWRETEDSLTDRIARFRASKGLPIAVEVVPATQFYFSLNKYSKRGQFRWCMIKRSVPIDDYADEVNARLSDERDAPIEVSNDTEDTWMPSADDWGPHATVIQLWSAKDKCVYEICEGKGEGMRRVEKLPMLFSAPPFALAFGQQWHSTEPTWAYEAALEGMYRHKAQYDRALSLFHALAEQNAIRRYVLQDRGNFPPQLPEDGDNGIDANPNSSQAGTVPGGKELKSFGGDDNLNDFAQALALISQEMDDSSPGTGRAQFGASTQPWSARIEQAQENIEPKMYLQNIAAAIQEMLQSIIEVFALPEEKGGPGEVFAWGSGQDGKLDRSETLSLKTEGWRGLIAEVNIDPVSAAERITFEEHLRNLVNDQKIQMSVLEYLEQTGDPHPQETLVNRMVNNYITEVEMPPMLKQAAAAAMGFRMGTDGRILAPGGTPMSGQEYLNVQQARNMGTMRPQAPGGMGTTPGSLPPAPQIPGAPPMVGLVG